MADALQPPPFSDFAVAYLGDTRRCRFRVDSRATTENLVDNVPAARRKQGAFGVGNGEHYLGDLPGMILVAQKNYRTIYQQESLSH
jgi:hypothetical protein